MLTLVGPFTSNWTGIFCPRVTSARWRWLYGKHVRRVGQSNGYRHTTLSLEAKWDRLPLSCQWRRSLWCPRSKEISNPFVNVLCVGRRYPTGCGLYLGKRPVGMLRRFLRGDVRRRAPPILLARNGQMLHRMYFKSYVLLLWYRFPATTYTDVQRREA